VEVDDMTVILNSSDFRTPQDGYHLDMWREIIEQLGLDPDEVDILTMKVIEVDYQPVEEVIR